MHIVKKNCQNELENLARYVSTYISGVGFSALASSRRGEMSGIEKNQNHFRLRRGQKGKTDNEAGATQNLNLRLNVWKICEVAVFLLYAF